MTFHQIAAFDFNYSPGFYQRLQAFSPCPAILHVSSIESLQSMANPEKIDCLVVSWKDELNAASLELLPSLKAVFVRGTNTSRIDCSWLSRRGIHLSTISAYGDIGTAEFVIHELFRSTLGTPRVEIAGKRIGLIGLGSVGLLVAKACHAMGMEVFYYTPTKGKNRPDYAQFLELSELLQTCNFISFHSPAYTHVVSPEQLQLLSPDAIVIMTTLGMPVDIHEFTIWKRHSKTSVILDLCTAQTDTALLENAGATVRNLYAARTAESMERAEAMLLNNMRVFVEESAGSRSIRQEPSLYSQATSLSSGA